MLNGTQDYWTLQPKKIYNALQALEKLRESLSSEAIRSVFLVIMESASCIHVLEYMCLGTDLMSLTMLPTWHNFPNITWML
jgi:hypothetical protein